jgi:hypothetical protein
MFLKILKWTFIHPYEIINILSIFYTEIIIQQAKSIENSTKDTKSELISHIISILVFSIYP